MNIYRWLTFTYICVFPLKCPFHVSFRGLNPEVQTPAPSCMLTYSFRRTGDSCADREASYSYSSLQRTSGDINRGLAIKPVTGEEGGSDVLTHAAQVSKHRERSEVIAGPRPTPPPTSTGLGPRDGGHGSSLNQPHGAFVLVGE